jgi:hypothetical protein
LPRGLLPVQLEAPFRLNLDNFKLDSVLFIDSSLFPVILQEIERASQGCLFSSRSLKSGSVEPPPAKDSDINLVFVAFYPFLFISPSVAGDIERRCARSSRRVFSAQRLVCGSTNQLETERGASPHSSLSGAPHRPLACILPCA